MATEAQIEKDLALAKKLGREPLLRHPNESDFEYSQRLRRSRKLAVVLTDEQIKLGHDMHAIHSAMARGYVLPPLPVPDEVKADDEAHAKELGVKPVERHPGETDAEFDARLAASPPVAAPNTDAEAAKIKEGQRLNALKEEEYARSAPTAGLSQPRPIGASQTSYPSHVDQPIFPPVEHAAPLDTSNA